VYSAQGMGAALVRRRRGVGDSQTLAFPFLSTPCAVGAIDPATGDTIAGCPGVAPAPPVLTQSMTVTAAGYPTWIYWAAGGVAGLLLLKTLRGR